MLAGTVQRRPQKGGLGGFGAVQQGCLKCRGHQSFQIAPANFRIGVFGTNDFALLGQADLPAYRAGWLRQNGLVTWTAATSHGAAAPMEHAQLDEVGSYRRWMLLVDRVEQLRQRNLGAVQLPVAGEYAAVLVAVGVAQHDVLFAILVGAAPLHHGLEYPAGHKTLS
jgi:hypothetical protein